MNNKKSIDLSGLTIFKEENDKAYQPVGNYVTEQQLTSKVDKETGKGLSTNDYTNEEKQKVADALVSADIESKANTSDVYTKSETYSKTEVNDLITTPNQQYVSVTATAQTTAVTDLLPATGAADTTYRVGNWDGTQYNDSVYSEYAWNGSSYIKLSTKSQVGEVYDISVNHADTKYIDIAAALGNDGANVPQSLRRGGMSVKFVQSSDNKYVQFRCMAQNFTIDVTQWQGVDDVPAAGSKNLVESGGVEKYIPITHKSFSSIDSTGNYICFVRDIPAGTTLKLKVTGSAEWNRLWISSNDNLGARLQDEVVKGTSYTITTASDITNIGLYVYSLSTSGSLRLDMEIVKTKSENDIIGLVTALRTDVDLIGNKISIDQTGWNKNKCIKSNGELNTSDPGYAYIKIPVLKGDSIKASFNLGFPVSRAVIALTDENESYYNVVLAGNNGNNYIYIATESGYICVGARFGIDETILSTAVEQIRIDALTAYNSLIIEPNIEAIETDIKAITEHSANLFDIDAPTGKEGKYKGYIYAAQRMYIANNGYSLSPYIEVEEGATYIGQINGAQYRFRFVYFYTNKGIDNIIDSQTISSQVWSVTVNSGYNIKYARFCMATLSSDEWDPTIMIQKGTEITPFEHFGLYVKNDALHKSYIEGIARVEAAPVRNFGLAGSLRDSATALAVSTNFTLSSLWVHNFLVTSARIKGTIEDVLVGVGYNVRYGGWIELTQTQAIVHFYYNEDMTVQTVNHGLTLGEDTMVSIFSNEAISNKVHVVIVSNGSQYDFDVTYGWTLGGTPFVRNANTSGTLDVELSATPQKITKQVWLFGDSYTYPYVDRTWTKWIFEWNGNKDPWLASQQPGISSSGAYSSLLSLISTGSLPKFIVWALGMNDGSDANANTPVSAWLTYANNLVSLCKQYNITPIFVTIPNVPTISHEGKNNWIRNSGYRYIDLAKAVGAETFVADVRNWYGAGTDYDYLAADGIHATAFGGRAMASQVLQDFPEIVCE